MAHPREEVLCFFVETCVTEPVTTWEEVKLLRAAEQLCAAEFTLLR